MTGRFSLSLAVVAALCAGVTLASSAGWATNPFVDIAGNTHADNIDAIYNARITLGCSDAEHYCPSDVVRRDQMASFLARGLGLSSGAKKHFPVANGRGPGQVYCALAAASPRSFEAGPCRSSTSTVDSEPSVGEHTSIAIGADGLPIIAYYDATSSDLKVAHCVEAACAGHVTVRAKDAAGTVGQHTSIAIGTDGLPVISYYDLGNGNLNVAHCVNVDCEAARTVTAVDTANDVGQHTSIAIGADGFPVISYRDVTSGNLKVAHCRDVTCADTPTFTAVDSDGSVGFYSSITVGTDGLPVISYLDSTNGDLKVVHCANAACTGTPTPSTVDAANAGGHTSIAIGIDGLPVISYLDAGNSDLKVAHCVDVACEDPATITAVDSVGAVGFYTSIAVGTDGLPVISYWDSSNGDLKVARCANVACTGTATRTAVDTAGLVGTYTSLAIGTDGLPVISYYDTTNGRLKVARPSIGAGGSP